MNARAISVWPAEDGVNTRIAICGESTNDYLPGDQLGPLNSFSSGRWRGFVAVFNNRRNGVTHDPQLLWSHQIFATYNGSLIGDMAVTDVSVRVEDGEDVVTYCGISNSPVLSSSGPFSIKPERAFLAPSSTCVPAMSGGDANNGANWDGFVGRLRRDPVGTTVEFHSTVGGGLDDGLSGLAELDRDRFCVVGTSALQPWTLVTGLSFPFVSGFPFYSSPPPPAFPPPFQPCASYPPNPQPFSVGVMMIYDASLCRPPASGSLILERSERLGSVPSDNPENQGPYRHTVARDVVAQLSWQTDAIPGAQRDELLVVVGETDDPNFFGANSAWPDASLDGLGPQGFVLCARSRLQLLSGLRTYFGTFREGGAEQSSGLVGVHSWSESPNHFAVVGYTGAIGGVRQLDVGQHRVTADELLDCVRDCRLGDGVNQDYQPCLLGDDNAGLAAWQGGGVCVNDVGRVTVVGGRLSGAIAVQASPNQAHPMILQGRASLETNEAYRAVLDMLPAGCGRTDGTGAPLGIYPVAGYSGGMTPSCLAMPFGRQIGMPAPAVPRMFINYVGPDLATVVPGPGGAQATITIVVDRPPESCLVSVSAWQIGMPGLGLPPVPLVLPEGTELWPLSSPGILYHSVGSMYSLDIPWAATWVPGASTPITVQWLGLIGPPSSGQHACPQFPPTVASPAIWFLMP
jgi:hypothetical protein